MAQITLPKQYCFTFADNELFLKVNSRGLFVGVDEFENISLWDDKEEAIGFQLAVNSNIDSDINLQLVEVTIEMSPIY